MTHNLERPRCQFFGSELGNLQFCEIFLCLILKRQSLKSLLYFLRTPEKDITDVAVLKGYSLHFVSSNEATYDIKTKFGSHVIKMGGKITVTSAGCATGGVVEQAGSV